jgi:hypothetical protein
MRMINFISVIAPVCLVILALQDAAKRETSSAAFVISGFNAVALLFHSIGMFVMESELDETKLRDWCKNVKGDTTNYKVIINCSALIND